MLDNILLCQELAEADFLSHQYVIENVSQLCFLDIRSLYRSVLGLYPQRM